MDSSLSPGPQQIKLLNNAATQGKSEMIRRVWVALRWKCGKREIQGQGQTRLTARWLFPDRVVTKTQEFLWKNKWERKKLNIFYNRPFCNEKTQLWLCRSLTEDSEILMNWMSNCVGPEGASMIITKRAILWITGYSGL